MLKQTEESNEKLKTQIREAEEERERLKMEIQKKENMSSIDEESWLNMDLYVINPCHKNLKSHI